MKKQIPLIIIFSFVLSLVQPAQALTIRERAQRLKEQAIALAKKGGAKSKELWQKINFLGNALDKEEKAAQKLNDCLHQHCKEVAYYSPILGFQYVYMKM